MQTDQRIRKPQITLEQLVCDKNFRHKAFSLHYKRFMTTQEKRSFDALCIIHRISHRISRAKHCLCELLKSCAGRVFLQSGVQKCKKMTLTTKQRDKMIKLIHLNGKKCCWISTNLLAKSEVKLRPMFCEK